MTKKQKTQKTILTIIMFAFALAVLFPFIWMLFCSFKPLNEIYEFPPRFLSGNMSLKNYRQVLFEQNPSFLTYLKNTTVTTVVSVLGTVITSSMAGYAFAKMKFRCRDQLFLLYLITMMEGLGEFGIFSRLVLPLAKPAMSTVVILNFVWRWNDYEAPLIFLTDSKLYTLTVGLTNFIDESGFSQDNLVMAAATVALIPIILVFILGQKYFIEGLTSGSVKG